jgi:hypothetical protein
MSTFHHCYDEYTKLLPLVTGHLETAQPLGQKSSVNETVPATPIWYAEPRRSKKFDSFWTS